MAFPMNPRSTAAGVYADIKRPARRIHALAYDASLVAGFSLVIALAAQVAVPLPFTPVPVTLQTLAALLTGAALGSRRGPLAVLLYLGEGLAGLPVFSGGRAGIAHLLGPTGGFLIGFVAAAFVAGFLAERGWTRRPVSALAMLLMANLSLYVTGLAWLGVHVGFHRVLALGFFPFVIGDALKIAAGWGLLSIGSIFLARKADQGE